MRVGFGSPTSNRGLPQRVVDALSSLPVEASSPLGQMLAPDAVSGSRNVTVVPSAPHGPILDHAAVAVTHCGHGTVMKALAPGVPMVCIPMGRDQNDTAARRRPPGARRPPLPRQRQRMARVIAAEAATIDVGAELEAIAGSGAVTV